MWVCLKVVLCKKGSLQLMSSASVISFCKFCGSANASPEKIVIACVSEGEVSTAALWKVVLLTFSRNFAVKFILWHIRCVISQLLTRNSFSSCNRSTNPMHPHPDIT